MAYRNGGSEGKVAGCSSVAVWWPEICPRHGFLMWDLEILDLVLRKVANVKDDVQPSRQYGMSSGRAKFYGVCDSGIAQGESALPMLTNSFGGLF